jgi:alpha-1,6-mannosyltransferase
VSGGSVVALVVVGAGLVTGVGLSWISSSLFSTPATARMALTPSTAVSVTLWEITHHFGARVEQHAASWESAATLAAFVLVGLFAVWLCTRVRYATLPRCLGLALVVVALGGPAAWPWYLSWGIVLLAADRRAQRSLWLPAVAVAFALPVLADGQVAIPLPDAWGMVLLYAAVASLAALRPRLPKIRVGRPRVGVPSIRHAPSEPSSVVTSRVPG